jgi:hypothetical protein
LRDGGQRGAHGWQDADAIGCHDAGDVFGGPQQRFARGAQVVQQNDRAAGGIADQGASRHHTDRTALLDEGQLHLTTRSLLEHLAEELSALDTADIRRDDHEFRPGEARGKMIHHHGQCA